jgi:hypothetical protein
VQEAVEPRRVNAARHELRLMGQREVHRHGRDDAVHGETPEGAAEPLERLGPVDAGRDELGDQAVVVGRDLVAGLHVRVDP